MSPTRVTVPFDAAPTVKVRVSPSASLPGSIIKPVESSERFNVASIDVGSSLTGITVIDTVALLLTTPLLSVATYVNESVPKKFSLGV